jgi:DNA modification methylase
VNLPKCEIFNEDCVTGMAERLPPESIDLCVSSIPFEDLFNYSNRVEDLGNNGSTVDIRAGRFALNMRFVVGQLHRVLKPGCNACIHVQQLLAFKNAHGFMGRRDFRGSCVDIFGAGGFTFAGEFVVQKDPQLMAQRMNLHSLQFKTGYARTATNLMPCPNDYVLIFQKPGAVKTPVRPIRHPKNPRGWVTQEEWVRDAHGVWTDIRATDVLDVSHTREDAHEKHVCALQLGVIRRLVNLYTNPVRLQPGVTVLDPFSGVGSTGWVCLRGDTQDGPLAEPRNYVGFELKGSYHKASLAYTGRAMRALAESGPAGQRSLFDAEPEPAAATA